MLTLGDEYLNSKETYDQHCDWTALFGVCCVVASFSKLIDGGQYKNASSNLKVEGIREKFPLIYQYDIPNFSIQYQTYLSGKT